ncbi:15411_t:CDS:2 [Acaulospora colombiana]|uniref:15411_t:CDS:1 n=1 Tax=Acaulospora colombiana TaxID=27376 RepID=A0ACA9K1K5_9GLOM|nr:15411_t:CDS:2 [Acaulospora colombiana]
MEFKNNEVETKYYDVDEDNSILSVKIPQDTVFNWTGEKIRGLSLFICLDISGTQFDSAFYSIITNLREVKNENLAIIFFTDGQNYGGDLEKGKENLATALAEAPFNTEVHSIGFTADHDAALLSWLTKCGKKEGNFQYVKSSIDIAETMKTTLELLEMSEKTFYIQIGDRNPIPVNFDEQGFGNVTLTGDSNKIDGQKVTVIKSIEDELPDKYELSAPRKIPEGGPESALMVIPFVQIDITRLSNEMINDKRDQEARRQKINEISELVNKYDEKINLILQNAFHTRSADRKDIIQKCMSVKHTIHQFKSVMSEALKGTLTNDKIASFNDIAYKNITKQRLKSRLDDRAVKNIDKMEEVEKKIKEVVDSLDFDQLESEETEENLRTLSCMITTDNYIEAMKEGECICLTLDVSRSQVAIADPSQIKVKKINQTFMSSGAFLDSVKFALGENAPEEVHGGFQYSLFGQSAIQGMARENITGVLPLYINERHWSIAREKMKPIMGYVTTLDIFGYTYSQITTVPFLVLAKAFSDTSSEFCRRQIKLIIDTCDAIYRESKYLRVDNKQSFEKYLESPLNRTIDVIPNNLVYLGHLLCALRCGDVTSQELEGWLKGGLIKYLIEEEIRRRLNKFTTIESGMNDVASILGIDKKEYIEDPVNQLKAEYEEYIRGMMDADKNSKIRYTTAIRRALAAAGADYDVKDPGQIKQDSGNVAEAPTIRAKLWNPETHQVPDSPVIKEVQNTFANVVETILRFNKIFESFITTGSTFESCLENSEFHFAKDQTSLTTSFFSQYSPKVRVATLLQSYKQRQNSERRDAILCEPIRYHEPFSEGTSDIIIETYFNEYVVANLNDRSSELIRAFNAEMDDALCVKFWKLDDEEQAAGLLLEDVKFRGRRFFGKAIKALQREGLALPKEKISMVIRGKWNGITLFSDKPNHPEDLERLARFVSNDEWHPSRRTTYRIIRAQRGQIPDVKWWIDLLPMHAKYLELQFDDELMKNLAKKRYEAAHGVTKK